MAKLASCQPCDAMLKPILDPCCGSRMFYFDRSDPRVEFCDVRHDVVARFLSSSPVVVSPDTVCDVTDLPFDDESFPLVVFKWSEKDVPLKDVLALAPAMPVCGNRRPGKSGTHWLVFFKGCGSKAVSS